MEQARHRFLEELRPLLVRPFLPVNLGPTALASAPLAAAELEVPKLKGFQAVAK